MKQIFLFFLSLPALSNAQHCDIQRYRALIHQADVAVEKGQYDLAVNKLQSAKTCQPDSETVVNVRIVEVFREVNRQRELAIRNEKEAKRQQLIAAENAAEARRQRDTATANLNKANRLIHHLNFQEEKAAWAYKYGKFAVINLNGDTLTDFIYEMPGPFRKGAAVAQVNNRYVFVDGMGREDSVRYDFLTKTPHGYFATRGGRQFILDEKRVSYYISGEFADRRKDHFIIIVKDRAKGLADPNGLIVIPPVYEDIAHFSSGVSKVKKQAKWGFTDTSGMMIGPAVYEYIDDLSNGFAAVKKDNVWGFVDSNGVLAILPAYKEVRHFSNGFARIQKDGKWGFVNKKGAIAVQPGYQYVEDFSESLAAVKNNDSWG
ncbi:MAG: WG repeat-containing protein, partial [Saprospiraceae bacterium]|nr:WG repeat-containing protein [Saprospiraceae bacterium]